MMFALKTHKAFTYSTQCSKYLTDIRFEVIYCMVVTQTVSFHLIVGYSRLQPFVEGETGSLEHFTFTRLRSRIGDKNICGFPQN